MSDNPEFSAPRKNNFDEQIKANFNFQLYISALLAVLFLAFRYKFQYIYTPNPEGRPQHPCYNYKGILSWIKPVVSIRDLELINIVGIDSFVFISTLRFFMKLFFLLIVLVGAPLLTIYYSYKSEAKDIFLKTSIYNVGGESCLILWLSSFMIYVVSFIVIYLLFVQSKKLIAINQIYKKNSASMMSLTTLKGLEYKFKNKEEMLKYINYPMKTIIVSNLPDYIVDNRSLQEYIKELGIGEIENSSFIDDPSESIVLSNTQKETIRKFESNIQESFDILKTKALDKLSDTDKSKISLFETNSPKKSYQNDTKVEISISEKKLYINAFIKNKIFQEGNSVDLEEDYKNLKTICTEIISARGSHDSSSTERSNTVAVNMEEVQTSILADDTFDDSPPPFLSITGLLLHGDESMEMSGSGNKAVAFVTFKEQRHANIAAQCRITSQIFSVNCTNAPRPRDIKWTHLKKSPLKGELRKIFSTCFFIVYALFFYIITTFLTALVQDNVIDLALKYMEKVEYLNQYKGKVEGFVNKFIKGMLAPVIFNTLIALSPYLIMAIISFKRLDSHTKAELSLLNMHSNFMLYVTIIGSFVGSQLSNLIIGFYSQEKSISLSEISEMFSKNIINVAALFFNTILQRMMVGSLNSLLKYGSLLGIFKKKRTTRERKDSRIPPGIQYGMIIPAVFLVLPMIMIYIVICPVMIFLGFIYFTIMYYLYKNELLYSSHNYFETGGVYWKYFLDYSIIVLVLTQGITMLQFSLRNDRVLTVSLLPCCFFTVWIGRFISTSYGNACAYSPINKKEDQIFTKFSKSVSESSLDKLDGWDSSYDTFTADSIFLSDLFDFEDNEYVYRDGAVSKSYKTLMLPNKFFDTMKEIKKTDLKGSLGFNFSK